MTFSTAKQIVEREIRNARSQGRRMELRLMGGEPFINFSLIKDLCIWIDKEYSHQEIIVTIRTNGTLLSDEIKSWLAKNHKLIKCGPSIDGIKEVNRINRGFNVDIKDFFVKHWPDYGAHGTLFPDSVEYLYESIIYFNEQLKYPFDIKIGLGTYWDDERCGILEDQLQKLCTYYCDKNTDSIPSVFIKNLSLFGTPAINDPNFNCLANQGGGVYDVDGTQYSCETLMPLIHGKDKSKQITDKNRLLREYAIDDECIDCKALAICPTCPSLNIKYRGDSRRSATLKTTCKAFKKQLKMSAYLVMLKYEFACKNNLQPEEWVMSNLDGAISILAHIDF